MKNQDDILETALNSGIAFTAQKYNITKDEVYKIVRTFKIDIGDLCSCDKARLKGETVMCFSCDGHLNRIKI